MRTCKVCTSKDRAAIEQDLLSGVSYRTIAHKYRISQDSIGRHKRAGHIQGQVAEAVKQTNLADAVNYWEKLEMLEAKCEEYLGLVEQNKIEGTRSQYIRELRETLKLILQIMHAKKEEAMEVDSPFKIITSAPWQTVMRILKGIYPDAEKKVLEALHGEHKAELPDAEGYDQEKKVEEVLKDEFEFQDKAEQRDEEIVNLPDVRLVVGRSHKPKLAVHGAGEKIEPQEDMIEPASQEPASIKSKEGPVSHDQADVPKNPGAKGNPGGQGAIIVRSQIMTTQIPTPTDWDNLIFGEDDD